MVSSLQAIITTLLALYSANEALGLFLFLMVEEAGVPLWFIPGDALMMAAGARPGNTAATVLLILRRYLAGKPVAKSVRTSGGSTCNT